MENAVSPNFLAQKGCKKRASRKSSAEKLTPDV
jgi:hypothetical protein